MRAILQRVEKSSVRVDQEVIGEIGRGLLVLLGVEKADGPADAAALAEKLATLRIFADDQGKMNLDAVAVGAELLIVSQFTLGATLARGRRPSFNSAARPETAQPLIEQVISDLQSRGFQVAGGRFGAAMQVELVNDGPVTFVLDVRDGKVQ